MHVRLINKIEGLGSHSFELAVELDHQVTATGLRINFSWAGRNYNEDIATFEHAYIWHKKNGGLLIAIDSILEYIAGCDAPSTTMYHFENDQLERLKNTKKPAREPDQIIFGDKNKPLYPW